MIKPMSEAFVSCLSSLDESELEKIEEVFYRQGWFTSPNTNNLFDQAIKDIASKMTANYYENRCQDKQSEVSKNSK